MISFWVAKNKGMELKLGKNQQSTLVGALLIPRKWAARESNPEP